MTGENHLALIVALYLSKFDKVGYEQLGYKGWAEAFSDIGKRLGANPNTIKQMREQFDPYYPNPRVGWHQRPLSPTRVRAIEEFDGLSFAAYAMLVRSLLRLEKDAVQLNDSTTFLAAEHDATFPEFPDQTSSEGTDGGFHNGRGKTGRQAENYFIELFNGKQLPFEGECVDCRDDGCGYDFLIRGDVQHAVEVKGLAEPKGDLLFTNREWETAQKRNDYSVFLAFNLGARKSEWGRRIIPSSELSKGVQTVQIVVQVNWRFVPCWN